MWKIRQRLLRQHLAELTSRLSSESPPESAAIIEHTVRLLSIVSMLINQHHINKRGQWLDAMGMAILASSTAVHRPSICHFRDGPQHGRGLVAVVQQCGGPNTAWRRYRNGYRTETTQPAGELVLTLTKGRRHSPPTGRSHTRVMSLRVDAVVIGGGHHGLVAAAVLADAGWDVCLLETTGRAHSGFIRRRS